MYQIKRLPQDFIVKEISKANSDGNGEYSYYTLKKISYSTVDALQTLSKKFRIPLKNFGFAGNKDKNAVSEQKISIFRGRKDFENVKLGNIELRYMGNGKEPISLGDLKGNEFIVTIRNLGSGDIKKIEGLKNKKLKIPNFYGSQRFSKNNHLVGKAIIKRDFRKAVGLVLGNSGASEEKIRAYLSKNKANYIGALRLIPLKTRRLLLHSYQSFLFNKIACRYIKGNKNSKKNIKIPVVGFGLDLESIKNRQLKKIIKNVLKEEKLNPREFIINEAPELASEGGWRDLFFMLEGLKILEVSQDELNENKQKVKVCFALPKSCYATVALEFFLQ